ncbi:MAG TPA: RNA pyrophosphohydrolase [Candidatus Megaira endosymbiont of Hartmannula sinica]|nr:RNA pyrophosphohydrolase [Candidatus Megaera endosymbiont of Hartmannula sinica]
MVELVERGGVDLDELLEDAVIREKEEEVGTSNAKIIAITKKWYSYKIPVRAIPKLWNGKYCGQKQKWFLIRFLGSNDEININTEYPEFIDWMWVSKEDLLKHVVTFKYKLYFNVLKEFYDLF